MPYLSVLEMSHDKALHKHMVTLTLFQGNHKEIAAFLLGLKTHNMESFQMSIDAGRRICFEKKKEITRKALTRGRTDRFAAGVIY